MPASLYGVCGEGSLLPHLFLLTGALPLPTEPAARGKGEREVVMLLLCVCERGRGVRTLVTMFVLCCGSALLHS